METESDWYAKAKGDYYGKGVFSEEGGTRNRARRIGRSSLSARF